MRSIEIQVECYAGGRAEETPRRITLDGQEHAVTRLLAETIEESAVTREQTRRYKVLTDQGKVLEIVRSSEGVWSLLSSDVP
jgi:hypothetical protein